MRTLLGPLGLSMPKTTRQAWLSLIWHRFQLRLRGLKFLKRDASQISAMALARIDLCWSAVAGLTMSEPIRGADFQTRGLLLALAAGEPLRIARALAMEAGHRATTGPAEGGRIESLLAMAAKIAQEIDSPYARGMIEMVHGFAALMRGQWQKAGSVLDGAEGIFRHHCTGVTWERDTVHYFMLRALVQMGEIRDLKERWSLFFRESQERGDLYAAGMLSAFYMTLHKLAGNEQPENEPELEALLEDGMGETFNLRHSNAFESLIHLYLYRSDVSRALARFETVWPQYEKSMLLRIRMTRIDLLEMRARCALAMAEKPGDSGVHLRRAENDAVRLEREGQKWALAHALYICAGIAACKEDPVRSIASLLKSAACYDEAQMPLRATCCAIVWLRSSPARRHAPCTTRPSNGSSPRELSRRHDGPACMLPASRRSPVNRWRRRFEAWPWPGKRASPGSCIRCREHLSSWAEKPSSTRLKNCGNPAQRGVIALVGLGGSGKTAIAARFLEEFGHGTLNPLPARLFVWSFYQEPDAGFFLQELHRYFAPSESPSTPAKGAALSPSLERARAGRAQPLGARRIGARPARGRGHSRILRANRRPAAQGALDPDHRRYRPNRRGRDEQVSAGGLESGSRAWLSPRGCRPAQS